MKEVGRNDSSPDSATARLAKKISIAPLQEAVIEVYPDKDIIAENLVFAANDFTQRSGIRIFFNINYMDPRALAGLFPTHGHSRDIFLIPSMDPRALTGLFSTHGDSRDIF